MDIFINRRDLEKICTHLDLTSVKELFTKGLIELVRGQNGVKLPKIRFRKTPYPHCPFLINSLEECGTLKGYCSLHPYSKPLVCKLAPVSRIYDSEKELSTYFITKPTSTCKGEINDTPKYIQETIENNLDELRCEEEFYKELEKDENFFL